MAPSSTTEAGRMATWIAPLLLVGIVIAETQGTLLFLRRISDSRSTSVCISSILHHETAEGVRVQVIHVIVIILHRHEIG